MRTTRAPSRWLGSLVLFAACTSVDPGADAADVRAAVQQRAATDADGPREDDDATAAVRDLLARPLDEEGAVRVMFLANHRVRSAYERLGIARADLVQAGLLRNPVFDLDARFLFDGGTEVELGLAAPFVDLFWRPLRTHVAAHEFEAAKLVVTDALVHAAFAVRSAFVDLRAANSAVELHRADVDAAGSAHQLAVELHGAGNLTDQALALERLGETRARLDLAAAELAAETARERLHVLLGLWGPDTAWTLADAPSPDPMAGVDVRYVESRAVAASLDLAAARAGIDALAGRADLASWRSWLPEGQVGASAIREPGGDWGLGPRFGMELPLFDTGAAGRARADATLRASLHDHAAIAVEIRSIARTLRTRLVHLAARERFLREVHLPQRAEVLRTTLQTYNAMQIGVFDVLRQRRLELADQLEHTAVLRDALRARLDLQQLLAGAMPKDRGPAEPPTRTAPDVRDTESRGH
ncbi:MAG: TolC family protein [Planctomycetes bacterium]|nr:TolC family protein [Planctomycetota bacterium]